MAIAELIATLAAALFAGAASFPTNRALLAGPGDSEASRLLAHWNRLHAVRTALSLAALVVFLLMR